MYTGNSSYVLLWIDINCAKRRQKLLSGKIPHNFLVGKTTADGNCLYNSASILLSGDQSEADMLRLSSVIHAVKHHDQYVLKVPIDSVW